MEKSILSLETPLSEIKRITPVYLKKLHKLEIKTLGDLLFHFPHRYDDFTNITDIENLEADQIATVQGEITDVSMTKTWKRKMYLVEAEIKDKTGSVAALWYNQPYLTQTLKKGLLISLSGKVARDGKKIFLQNPAHEILRTENHFLIHTGRLIPVYPETKGLTSRWLRFQIKQFLPVIKEIKEFLPSQIIQKNKFLALNKAIEEIHFPTSQEQLEQAKRRLGFDEVFLIQLFLASRRSNLKKENAHQIEFEQPLIKDFVDNLPFKLTNTQRQAAWEIFQDIAKNNPMNRLLNGDVGSGKTLVATLASLQTAKRDFQVAFMVPTEVLSWQHFNTLVSLLKNHDLDIVLASSSQNKHFNAQTKNIASINKNQLNELIKTGVAKVIIGTHTLIQKDIKFKNLALVIIDEQHRFGVQQRAKLVSAQTFTPHLLSMTATPIPRTLTLAVYGDLDISILNEMPKGYRTVETKVVLPKQAQQIYQFVAEKIKNDNQVFVICPRIEEPDQEEILTKKGKIDWQRLEMKAVETEYEKLKKIFPNFKLAKLHGRMKSQEKTEILGKMQRGEINMLVSTSVIEVGIDIPKASILWVENAERFGLAQLHQFRGRIGREGQQAWCFLFSGKENSQRLKAMIETNDGFKLAQKDLEIRGPGEFYGVKQWGFPELTIGSLMDYQTVKLAREEALELLKEDSNLSKHPTLKEKFADFTKNIHLE